jgi:hypothetical protein
VECDTWFELWGSDGFNVEFIADFDTREEAEAYDKAYDHGYQETRIKRAFGIR